MDRTNRTLRFSLSNWYRSGSGSLAPSNPVDLSVYATEEELATSGTESGVDVDGGVYIPAYYSSGTEDVEGTRRRGVNGSASTVRHKKKHASQGKRQLRRRANESLLKQRNRNGNLSDSDDEYYLNHEHRYESAFTVLLRDEVTRRWFEREFIGISSDVEARKIADLARKNATVPESNDWNIASERFRKVVTRRTTRALIRKHRNDAVLLELERALYSYRDECAAGEDAAAMEFELESSFHRLLLHAIARYMGMKTETHSESGRRIVHVMMTTDACPSLSLSQYLDSVQRSVAPPIGDAM